jgi:hypothetical protein
MCAGEEGGIGQGAYTTYIGQNTTMVFATTTVLFLETLSGNPTSTSTSSIFSSSPSTSSTFSSLPVSSTTTSSPATSLPSAASATTVSVGPIVGGVLGGVAALVAVAAGIYFWRRKRRDPVRAEQPGYSAHSAQGYNSHLLLQELNGPEPIRKGYVAEVAGDHGGHEIMGSEVYR